MKIIKMNNRELLDLSLVLIISIAFTLFSLSINFIDRMYNYFYALTSLPMAEFLINVIFLWLVGLLWITYCRWRRAVKRQKELENIISSISPDALMVVDTKRNIVMCDVAVKRMFGYEVEEVINQKTDLLYCDRRSDSSIKHEIYDALENIGFHTGLATGRKKNNDTIPLEIITAKLRGREGAVLLLRDISERKRAEEELKQQAAFARNDPAPVLQAEYDGKITRFNPSAKEVFKKDLKKESLHNFLPEVKGFFINNNSINEPFQFKRSIGKETFLFTVKKEESTRSLYIYGSNITKLKQAEEELRETKEYLDNLIESSLDAIVVSDDVGNVCRVNKSFLKLIGFEEEEVIGKHIMELSIMKEGTYESTTGDLVELSEEFFNDSMEMTAKLYEEGKVSHWESYYHRKDGKIVPVEMEISHLYNEKGDDIGSVGICRDITERRKAEKKITEGKKFLENIFRTSADGIIITNPQGFITMVNESVERMLGYSQDELMEKHTAELRPEGKEYEEKGKKYAESLLEKGVACNSEIPWVRKDGSLVDIERSASLLKDKKGNVTGAVASVRDVTERKRSEKEIKEAKDFLENIFRTSVDGIFITDNKGVITMVNEAVEKILGYSKEQLIGKHSRKLVPKEKEYEEEGMDFINKLHEEGTVIGKERTLLREDGSLVDVEQSAAFLKDKEGNLTGSVASIRDVTERKRFEERLKKSEEKYYSLIEKANDAIISSSKEGIIVGFNKKAEEMFGYNCEEVIGKSVLLLLPQSNKKINQDIIKRLKTSNKTSTIGQTLEAVGLRKDGQEVIVEASYYSFEVQGEDFITAVIRDISERKKMEREIKETKDFLENVIESSRDGILIVDEKGYIFSCNKAIEEMSGFSKEEMVGEHASILTTKDKEIRKRILEKTSELFEQGFTTYETIFKSKEGKNINIECISSMIKNEEGDYIAGVSILRDVTERKEMERKFLQSEKLKSLGELSGGVAHDFNNILAAILGRAQLLKMIVDSPPGKQERRKSMIELKRGLEVIEKASLDGAETVRRIQEFARRREEDKRFTTINLNEIIENAFEFTKVRWKDDAESKGIKIKIQKEFSTLPTTSGSATELREVFTNIINNAVDAMPQGGDITIKTFKEGNHACIKVTDTGIGIPQTVGNRIFDPFFTTKGPQSSGLGMSVSYGIIHRHRGTIMIDSVEGKGTTFTIEIPFSEEPVEEGKVVPISSGQKRVKILIIEDEEDVCNVLKDILTHAGHRVETASNGKLGIEKFKKKAFDMVLTDLGMPGMSGWQVAEKIKAINGRVPIALITGWSIDLKESEMKEKGIDFIIQKPYKLDQLVNVIQEGMILRERFKAV